MTIDSAVTAALGVITKDMGAGRDGGPFVAGLRDCQALGLSAREAEVAHLVTIGMPNKEIAQRLCLSPGTVRKHLDNIYRKLDVHSRGALTAFLLELEIVGG